MQIVLLQQQATGNPVTHRFVIPVEEVVLAQNLQLKTVLPQLVQAQYSKISKTVIIQTLQSQRKIRYKNNEIGNMNFSMRMVVVLKEV